MLCVPFLLEGVGIRERFSQFGRPASLFSRSTTAGSARIPRDGEPATLPTEVRIGHDESALYIGVRALDDQPSLIVPGEALRDYDLAQSDAIMLIFDTYHDGVNGFVFGTNPAGIQYDGQVVDQGSGSGRRRRSLAARTRHHQRH